jgi:hypothetical protein
MAPDRFTNVWFHSFILLLSTVADPGSTAGHPSEKKQERGRLTALGPNNNVIFSRVP